MSDYFHKIMSKYRRVILFLTDFVIVCSAYLFTWVLISGRADMNDYYSLMISSCFLLNISSIVSSPYINNYYVFLTA